jgi:hypothetical protein
MEPMTDAQRRTLNAACGDLAAAISWHGHHFDKNDFRHFFAGIVRGNRLVPAWDYGDGKPRGFVYMGGSSRELTKEEASECIDMAFALGDDPRLQGIDADPVRWGPAVCRARLIPQDEQ